MSLIKNQAFDVFECARGAIDKKASQVSEELAAFYALVALKRPKVIVEIGTYLGGTLWGLGQMAAADALIVSIDLPAGPYGGGCSEEHLVKIQTHQHKQQKRVFLREDSHAIETKAELEELLAGRTIDVLFIDGDHSYEGAKTDYQLYSPLVTLGGLIGLHDIQEHPPALNVEVCRLWQELLDQGAHGIELISDPKQDWAGIGVIVR